MMHRRDFLLLGAGLAAGAGLPLPASGAAGAAMDRVIALEHDALQAALFELAEAHDANRLPSAEVLTRLVPTLEGALGGCEAGLRRSPGDPEWRELWMGVTLALAAGERLGGREIRSRVEGVQAWIKAERPRPAPARSVLDLRARQAEKLQAHAGSREPLSALHEFQLWFGA
jgi:hypothetical protein